MMVFNNRYMKNINPELYAFMLFHGFEDKPLKKNMTDPWEDYDKRSLYLLDGKYGSFIFNQNFAYVLVGAVEWISGGYHIHNTGVFFYHKKRGGYSEKGECHIGPAFYIIHIDNEEAMDKKMLVYRSQAIRTALLKLARTVPNDHAPKKGYEIFRR